MNIKPWRGEKIRFHIGTLMPINGLSQFVFVCHDCKEKVYCHDLSNSDWHLCMLCFKKRVENMVKIKDLKQNDVGRWVRYTPQVGNEEIGRIKSWNEKFIFVVYKCDNQWERFQDFTAAATDPADLTFIENQ